MKTGFSILYLVFSSVMMAQSVHLTVPAVDASNGAVTIGMAYFTWGQFTDNNGVTVQAGQLTRPVTNGTIDVTLTASDNAGYVYTFLFMHGSTADTFKWRVPAAGAASMAELNQPPATGVDPTLVRKDQANTYVAGTKQTFSSSPTTAGEGFAGVSADPSTAVTGDRWYRTDLHHMRIFDGSAARSVMYQSDSLPWNQIGNPTATTNLLFAANPFNIAFGNATGAGNMMTVVDTASNTGTGYVFSTGTSSGSVANPFQVLAKGSQALAVLANGNLQIGSGVTDSVISIPGVAAGLQIQLPNQTTAAFRLLPYSGDIYFQNTNGAGNIYFTGPSGSDLGGAAIFRTGGIVLSNNAFIVSGSGSTAIAGLQTAVKKNTVSYTATNDDLSLPCDAAAGNVTISLPAAPKIGEWKAFKKVDSSTNTCTYSGNGKTIDGAATVVYGGQYAHGLAQYDGTQWWIY